MGTYTKMGVWTLLILALFACSTAANQEEKEQVPERTSLCESEYTYGGRLLCMPPLDGYVECYADSVVARRFKPLNEGNTVMALYMPHGIPDSLRAQPLMPVWDYHRVWAFRKKWEYFANDAAITEAEVAWFEELKRSPRADLGSQEFLDGITGTTPIEVYRPSDYMATAVYLVPLSAEDGAGLSVMTYSALALRTKLVFTNYYQRYTGPESVREAKQKAETLGNALLEANQ